MDVGSILKAKCPAPAKMSTSNECNNWRKVKDTNDKKRKNFAISSKTNPIPISKKNRASTSSISVKLSLLIVRPMAI